jgi:Sensors of blue-light using FAD
MPLIRLIYRSRNAINVAGNRMLIHYHDIVTTARLRNASLDITGFLMFDRQWYHQILEGEEEVLDDLYRSIKADARHRDVETLTRDVIAKRDFPDWSMGSFLNEGKAHPLQAKHGIAPAMPLEGETFLKFALAFAELEPHAA